MNNSWLACIIISHWLILWHPSFKHLGLASVLVLDCFNSCTHVWWATRKIVACDLLFWNLNYIQIFIVADCLLMLLLIIHRIKRVILYRPFIVGHWWSHIYSLYWGRWLYSTKLLRWIRLLLLLFFELIENIISYFWMSMIPSSELSTSWLIACWILSLLRGSILMRL